MNRVFVFIDGNNLYFALKRNQQPTRVDYYQFGLALTGKERKLERIFYYNSSYDKKLFPEKAATQQPFLESLDKTPFVEVRLGHMASNGHTGLREKGVGILLASEMVYYAARNLFDTAILVSESEEYTDLLKSVNALGKRVEVALFPDHPAKELMNNSAGILDLERLLEDASSKIFPPNTPGHSGHPAEHHGINGNSF